MSQPRMTAALRCIVLNILDRSAAEMPDPIAYSPVAQDGGPESRPVEVDHDLCDNFVNALMNHYQAAEE